MVVEQAGVAIPWAELTPEARTRWHRDHHTNKTGFLGVTWKRRERRFVAHNVEPVVAMLSRK